MAEKPATKRVEKRMALVSKEPRMYRDDRFQVTHSRTGECAYTDHVMTYTSVRAVDGASQNASLHKLSTGGASTL